MSAVGPPAAGEARREALALGVLCAVLFYTSWNFKVVSSLPRLLDPARWWAPLVAPEALLLVAALLLCPGAWRGDRGLPRPRLFFGSVALYSLGALVSTAANPVHGVYLSRVMVFQYALPLVLFAVVVRAVTTAPRLRRCAWALVSGGLTLFLVATPVYFRSFAAFPPTEPLWWPASRILSNRGRFGAVHNHPRMLYDNVTFGNFLNVSQILVVLLALALGLYLVAATRRGRGVAALAAGVFLLHLFLCYGRGAILVTLVTLAVALAVFWRRRHPGRWTLTALAAGFALVTFVSPVVPGYWRPQFTIAEGSTARERLGFVIRPLNPWQYLTPTDRMKYRPAPGLEGGGLWRSYARMLTLGLGYGNYGVLVGQPPGAGTHNLFLNALVSTGPLGLAGLLGLVGWGLGNYGRGLARGWRGGAADPTGGLAGFCALALANIVLIGTLSLYELEYLGTSTGALLLWLLLALSARSGAVPAEAWPC